MVESPKSRFLHHDSNLSLIHIVVPTLRHRLIQFV